jgi:hypothetical protein
MKRIIAILILTFVCLLNTSFSQTKTPYEKKKEEISIKYLKKMGVSTSDINRAKSADESGMLLLLLIVEKMQNYQYSHGMEALVLMSEWEKENMAAEKLKNDEDFRKEHLKKEKEENKVKAEQAKYEEQKRIEDQENEKQKLLEFYNNSDLGSTKEKIKIEFENWLTKGEFEKTEDFSKRLALRELKFLEICDQALLEKLSEEVEYVSGENWYGDNSEEESFVLYDYNADYEFFPFYFRYKQMEFQDTIYIPFSDAEQFKEQTDYYSISYPKKREDYVFANYYLYPAKIIFQNINKKTSIEVSLNFDTQVQSVQFGTDELNLSNYSFEKIQYNFQNFKQRKSEILIENAKMVEESGDLENALILYTKIIEFDKNSEVAKSKVETITKTINERKRGLSIKEAEKLFKNGQLSKSKEKYLEANSIRKSDDIDEIIRSIEKSISESNQKHNELLILFNQTEKNNSFIKNGQMAENLEKTKKGYSEKYKVCLDTINYILNADKAILKKQYDEYIISRNKEIWSIENQNLMEVFKDFNNIYEKMKAFEENILKAIQQENKKYLKILKEDDINVIIDFVIKTNSNE